MSLFLRRLKDVKAASELRNDSQWL